MELTGTKGWLALGAAFVLGVIPGALTCATQKPQAVAVDAGVSIAFDAGVASKASCEVTITRWERIPVYVQTPTKDGGIVEVSTSGQVQYVYLPDVRLSGHSESVATQQVSAQAEASATVPLATVSPEKHWEVGPLVQYGLTTQSVSVGAMAGASFGPLGIHVQALKSKDDVLIGASLGWRF